VRVSFEDDWADDVGVLDREAREVIAFLEALCAQPALAALVAGPVEVRVDLHGVVTTTLGLGVAELSLQAGDGWDRVIWRAPPAPPREWPWDDVQSPVVLRALMQAAPSSAGCSSGGGRSRPSTSAWTTPGRSGQ